MGIDRARDRAIKDPDRRLQAATAALVDSGILSGALRVLNAAAPIEVTADLRVSRLSCSMTVEAPTTGRAATRVNWLVRQLRDSKPEVCIETITLRQRGKGTVRKLAELREAPKAAIDDPSREVRAFTISLSANAGTKRGKGRGSFVASVLSGVEAFYAKVAQHIKPWTRHRSRSATMNHKPPRPRHHRRRLYRVHKHEKCAPVTGLRFGRARSREPSWEPPGRTTFKREAGKETAK